MKQIKSLIQQFGYLGSASYITSRLLGKFLGIEMHHYKFYLQPVCTIPRVSAAKLERYNFSWINQPDKILDALERPEHVIKKRFDQGSICLVAKQQEQFQGCLWLIPSQYIEDEVRATYHFPNSTVWDYDVYVTPKKRFTILFAALWDMADRWMKKQGYTHSFSRISAYNPQSVRSHEAAGAKQIGWMITLAVYPRQLTISDHSPRIYFASKNDTCGPDLFFDKI